jgi:hypothetical protein
VPSQKLELLVFERVGRLADQGLGVPPREEQTPEALGNLQKAEIEKWWPIMKAANIRDN